MFNHYWISNVWYKRKCKLLQIAEGISLFDQVLKKYIYMERVNFLMACYKYQDIQKYNMIQNNKPGIGCKQGEF